MKYKLTDGYLDGPADEQAIGCLTKAYGESLPNNYIEFLRKHNGGEGFIGKNYIILWKAEEIVDFNREYEVETYAPDIILFGSSGGGEGYGFDCADAAKPVVRIPFIGMERQYAKVFATNIEDLFLKLLDSNGR